MPAAGKVAQEGRSDIGKAGHGAIPEAGATPPFTVPPAQCLPDGAAVRRGPLPVRPDTGPSLRPDDAPPACRPEAPLGRLAEPASGPRAPKAPAAGRAGLRAAAPRAPEAAAAEPLPRRGAPNRAGSGFEDLLAVAARHVEIEPVGGTDLVLDR